MHFKREISTSCVNTVSDSIKRLAISHDGHPERVAMANSDHNTTTMHPQQRTDVELNNRPILTVMSNAKDDFISRYDIIREIGKGGFSIVYHCRHKITRVDYAVKVVDLRPLRLRERFNPTRLKREVEIMRRLKHPNIIQFIEVYEDPDYLMMVLEYCPGTELFDVIIARSKFTELEARPIFAQIAKALFYLHSLNIIHRDIKPENILIHRELNPATGEPIAKLLDFGLSKNAGVGGSAGKTFVGTPCYLAPEVEMTQKGGGTTYGLAADCWSLGAVLYVMLVGRFPEFERDFAGKVVVRLSPALWDNVSNNAKDLVRSLMNTNQFARITMANVLKHPWMERFQMTQTQIEAATMSCYYLGRGLQEEEEKFLKQQQLLKLQQNNINSQTAVAAMDSDYEGELTASGSVVYPEQAMVLRTNHQNNEGNNNAQNENAGPEPLPLAPLLQLQRNIATCFEEAHEAYAEYPGVASQVRKGATLCREQLTVSTKMLRKVEQTANAVLSMFPDLELAIEEEEPRLAAEFFNLTKGWVVELAELVHTTQKVNKASMEQIQEIVENSTSGLVQQTQARKKAAAASTITMPKRLLGVILSNLKIGDKLQIGNGEPVHAAPLSTTAVDESGEADESIDLDANQILELFMSLFSVQNTQNGVKSNSSSAHDVLGSPEPESVVRQNTNNSTGSLNSNGHGRVTSIDSDASNSMDMERKNTMSPPFILEEGNSHSSLGVGSTGNSAFVPIKHHTTAGSEESYKAHGPGRVDISKLPSDASTVTLNSTAHSSLDNLNDDNIDTNDHRHHNSMHVFLNTQHKQQQQFQQQNVPLSLNVPQITNGNVISDTLQASSTAAASNNAMSSPNPRAANKLAEALQKLRQVDVILEQLSMFWANTEVVLDLLTKKGQHVEQFIGFSTKPKLMARFKERIEEYKRFWEGVSIMSSNYITGVNAAQQDKHQQTSSTPTVNSPAASQKMYGFLEKSNDGSNKQQYRQTPPSSAMKDINETPPPSMDSNTIHSKSPGTTAMTNSFDSMGGIFSYIASVEKGSPLREQPNSMGKCRSGTY